MIRRHTNSHSVVYSNTIKMFVIMSGELRTEILILTAHVHTDVMRLSLSVNCSPVVNEGTSWT